MSPLYELSTTALSVVIVIGAITALFMGLVAMVQNDIKRVVAYSTLSQLGYMTVALGASAYSAAIFHLMTHAFFKAVLFLGAGSVIIAMHHEQDMRRMGGLRKYMPITFWTVLIGSLAGAGIPPFAGFYSKDAIIEAAHLANLPGGAFAYFAVLSCVFVTAFYSFRLVFMTFFGEERFRHAHGSVHGHDDHAAHDEGHGSHGHGADAHAAHGHDPHDHDDEHGHHGAEPRESPWVVTVPLVFLAIMSIVAGFAFVGPVVFGDYFGKAIVYSPDHNTIALLSEHWHGVLAFTLHGMSAPPFWIALGGIATAWYLYIRRPDLPPVIAKKFGILYTILDRKYGFDEFNEWLFARGARNLGTGLWKVGDVAVIDGFLVNGAARTVGWVSGVVRHLQTGRIYHYAFTMIIGVFVLISLWATRG